MKRVSSFNLGLVVVLAFAAGLFGGSLSIKFYLDSAVDGESTHLIEERVYIEESELVSVVPEVLPAVVSVVGEEALDGGRLVNRAEGTGFIVTSDGLILTNKHVVQNEGADYRVALNDGSEYRVEVVSRDPFDDVAVLRVVSQADSLELPVLNLGDSSELKVGQRVVAFGNALALYDNTVTAGIVSALSRNVAAFNDGAARVDNLSGLIQTDAAINRGNSGGPLVNLAGEVIGMNVAVAEANGIGFAIPVDDLKPILRSVEKYGEIVRPVLGVRFVMLTEGQAEDLGFEIDSGAFVVAGQFLSEPALIAGGPADKAGIVDRDVIIALDGEAVTLEKPLQKMVREYDPGDKVMVEVYRGGEVLEFEVVLGSSKEL